MADHKTSLIWKVIKNILFNFLQNHSYRKYSPEWNIIDKHVN
jgi:hypothetical protein